MLTSGPRTAEAVGVSAALREAQPSPASPWRPAPSLEANADVLAVNRVDFFGGVERVILTAAAGVAARGWRTALACPPGELARRARMRLIPVHPVDICSLSLARMGRSPIGWARTLDELRRGSLGVLRAALATRAQIIHTHHPVTALQARRAARFCNAPLIWHVHETAPIPLHYRGLAAMVVRSCDLFLCVSEASREMVRELGAPEARTHLVYNAVEPRFFRRRRAARPARSEGPNVGVFGVLEPRKGHADLIRACAALSGRWPTLHLWVVGGPGASGQEQYPAALKGLARQLGIRERVHFIGRREDIPDLMAGMDAVVSASVSSESLPTVLLEASALGVPVLGTDVGGASEIIRHGETGLLAPPGAPEALAANLALLLSPAGRVMAERARENAARKFSADRFAADIGDVYQELARRDAEPRS